MNQLLLVAAGGAVGSVARHLVGNASLRVFGPGFPGGTLLVNVAGSLMMGLFVGLLAARLGGSENLRLLVATGFLGGFTTFSAFSLDAVTLWQRGDTGAFALYVLGSVVVSLLGLGAGLLLARILT